MTETERDYDAEVETWELEFDRLAAQHAFGIVASHWHSGQWSDFYKLQCNGTCSVTDYWHATGVWSEARKCLTHIDPSDQDYEALTALVDICDRYPIPPDQDDN